MLTAVGDVAVEVIRDGNGLLARSCQRAHNADECPFLPRRVSCCGVRDRGAPASPFSCAIGSAPHMAGAIPAEIGSAVSVIAGTAARGRAAGAFAVQLGGIDNAQTAP